MKKLAIFSLVLVFSLSFLSAEETQYNNYSFARLSFITGNSYVQRASDLGFEESEVNMPISEGDRLGTTDGRVEVYFGKRNYIRLDNDTKIDFLNLPKRGYDLSRFRIWSGNVYFTVSFLEKEKNVEIHTSDVSIYVLEKGTYRIDVRENRETEIFVFEGLVEAASEEGSVLIGSEKRLEIASGRFTSQPTNFYAVAEDSFDRWSEHRDNQLRKRIAKRYLPQELEDFEYELSEYGDWVYLRPNGWVWMPRGLDSGWRPYHYGRWSWLPSCGWSWLSYEPWGWAPYHYGRWNWGIGLGWYWMPTSYWGPAWVNWWWGYDYMGWSPMGYNNYFPWGYNRTRPYYYRGLTVIRKGQMQDPNISNISLRQAEVKKLGKISFTNKPPTVKPVSQNVSLEKLGEKLILKKEQSSSEVRKRSPANSITKDPRLVDPNRDGKQGQKIERPIEKVIKSTEKGTAIVENKIPPTQKLIKKEIKDESLPPNNSKRYIKGGTYGYPSSPKISIKNIPKSSRTQKSSSILGRIYRYISGNSGTKSVGNSGSRSSSGKSSSGRISSSSGSKGSSSRGRVSSGSSSSGRSSSGSKSGRVVKKK